jgi:hypothetical protein
MSFALFALWVLAPFLVLVVVVGSVAAVVGRRRYRPAAEEWQDYSGMAARGRDDGHVDPHGRGW